MRAELSDDPGTRNPPRWRAVAHPALAGLAPAGLALMAVAVLPPVETLARRYLFVESVQFCLLALAGPALIVLGAPWRLLRLSRWPDGEPAGRPDQAGT
ncbi:MAG: cytochrome c oxidase assembly protein, partial [Streptosporangiaceae bacterium]